MPRLLRAEVPSGARAHKLLHAAAKEAGMTLAQIGTTLGLSRQYMSKLSRGEAQPSLEAAVSISELLGIAEREWVRKGAKVRFQRAPAAER